MPKQDIATEIGNSIIAKITEGKTLPWSSPYLAKNGFPRSVSTGKAYRGINVLILSFEGMEKGYSSSYWGTYKKIAEMNGQIRKGERSTRITFWSTYKKDVVENGKTKNKTFRILRAYNVFNVQQADWEKGLPKKFQPVENDSREGFSPIAEAEAILAGYKNGPKIVRQRQDVAYYAPLLDVVNVPSNENLRGTEEFYSTMFHELTHSTGHSSRLNREGITSLAPAHRGNLYSFEELIAEFGAAFLCGASGITNTVDNSASYIASWLSHLKNDPAQLVKAAGQAQKAMDHILGVVWENTEENA